MTTEAKHTPEPWEIDKMPSISECQKHGDWIMLRYQDWKRAQAAVNACAGIPTEQLEAGCIHELVISTRDLLDWLEELRRTGKTPTYDSIWPAQRALAPFQEGNKSDV